MTERQYIRDKQGRFTGPYLEMPNGGVHAEEINVEPDEVEEERVSKEFSPKVRNEDFQLHSLKTGHTLKRPRQGAYQYNGKSLILRRPKYTMVTLPKNTKEIGDMDMALKRTPLRTTRAERRAVHESYKKGKSHKAWGNTYKIYERPVSKALAMKPMGLSGFKMPQMPKPPKPAVAPTMPKPATVPGTKTPSAGQPRIKQTGVSKGFERLERKNSKTFGQDSPASRWRMGRSLERQGMNASPAAVRNMTSSASRAAKKGMRDVKYDVLVGAAGGAGTGAVVGGPRNRAMGALIGAGVGTNLGWVSGTGKAMRKQNNAFREQLDREYRKGRVKQVSKMSPDPSAVHVPGNMQIVRRRRRRRPE